MPSSFEEAVRHLGAVSKQNLYVYDLCSGTDAKGKQCDMVYRNSYAHHDQCPRCKTARSKPGEAPRQLRYLSIRQWLCNMLADAQLARCVIAARHGHADADMTLSAFQVQPSYLKPAGRLILALVFLLQRCRCC